MFGEISLDKIASFISRESENDENLVDISRVKSNRMSCFSCNILKSQKIIRHLRWPSNFTGAMETKNEEIQDQSIVLGNEARKLKSANNSISIGVIHIFV